MQNVSAQEKEVNFLIANDGNKVTNPDSAFFIRSIAVQPDAAKLYDVIEYYRNGQVSMITKSNFSEELFSNGKVSYQGQFVSYYPDGKKLAMGTLRFGRPIGDVTFYYPNGKLYSTVHYNRANLLDGSISYVECYDTLGRATCQNGNGYWLDYYPGYKRLRTEGAVKNSLEEGIWKGHVLDSIAITSVSYFQKFYKKGELKYVKSFNRAGEVRTVEQYSEWAKYTGDITEFVDRVKKAVVKKGDPKLDTLSISFIVQSDGKLTGIGLKEVSDDQLNQQIAAAVLAQKPWKAGTYLGFNIPFKVTVPLKYKPKEALNIIEVTEELLGSDMRSIKLPTTELY